MNYNLWRTDLEDSIIEFGFDFDLPDDFNEFVDLMQKLNSIYKKYGLCLLNQKSADLIENEDYLRQAFEKKTLYYNSSTIIDDKGYENVENYYCDLYIYNEVGKIVKMDILFVHSMPNRFMYLNSSLEYYNNYKRSNFVGYNHLRNCNNPVNVNFAKLPREKLKWELSYSLWSEIWVQKLHRVDHETSDLYTIDNSPIAYRNVPRINSFIRDIKVLVQKYESKYSFGIFHKNDEINYETAIDGLPLDGKIIYQEDIDEGRVILPD
ncbi:MAG TPA: hypothetical protein PK246_11090 [Saprospiraceae bacterium]|nr:hypothetical protein [Saprospiraceae bacterium]